MCGHSSRDTVVMLLHIVRARGCCCGGGSGGGGSGNGSAWESERGACVCVCETTMPQAPTFSAPPSDHMSKSSAGGMRPFIDLGPHPQ